MRLARTSMLACGLLLAAALTAVAGCGGGAPPAKVEKEAKGTEAAASGHDHSHWWCAEHGVPEEMCSICSTKLAAKFKKDGDWCDKHDRADSQCFICHPEKFAKFAAMYEAKYGKQPEKPTE